MDTHFLSSFLMRTARMTGCQAGDFIISRRFPRTKQSAAEGMSDDPFPVTEAEPF
jgi:hypothetical protein